MQNSNLSTAQIAIRRRTSLRLSVLLQQIESDSGSVQYRLMRRGEIDLGNDFLPILMCGRSVNGFLPACGAETPCTIGTEERSKIISFGSGEGEEFGSDLGGDRVRSSI